MPCRAGHVPGVRPPGRAVFGLDQKNHALGWAAVPKAPCSSIGREGSTRALLTNNQMPRGDPIWMQETESLHYPAIILMALTKAYSPQ